MTVIGKVAAPRLTTEGQRLPSVGILNMVFSFKVMSTNSTLYAIKICIGISVHDQLIWRWWARNNIKKTMSISFGSNDRTLNWHFSRLNKKGLQPCHWLWMQASPSKSHQLIMHTLFCSNKWWPSKVNE